jgi:peptidoglycan/LPS O-acetylase OafA/YrhL
MSISAPIGREISSPIRQFFSLELLDNRYPVLHAMRVFAIASVVQFHVTDIALQKRELPLNAWFAQRSMDVIYGMDLFFVLSGFLIGSILLRSVEKSGSQNVGRFYLRRMFRTFPSYYVMLTYLLIIKPWGPLTSAQEHHLILEYTYLTDYGNPRLPHDLMMPWGWSLAVEEKFYFAVPFLVLLLRKLPTHRSRLLALGLIWASALGIRLAVYFSHSGWTEDSYGDAVYFKSHTRYDTLVAGVILAYVQHRWREPMVRWLESRLTRALLGAVVVGCFAILLAPKFFGGQHYLLLCVFMWGTITTIMYFAMLLLLINRPDGWISRLLSARFFRPLATLGYGVYLVHIPLAWWPVVPAELWLRDNLGWSMAAVWPAALVLLLGLSLWWAYGLHLFVEKPFLRLRERVAG